MMNKIGCLLQPGRDILFVMLLVLLLVAPAGAVDEDRIVITAGPSWPGFTNRDGHGLYHDIIQAIYAQTHDVRHIYITSDQANALVAAGRADIKKCETQIDSPLLLGKYPMYENAF